MRSKMLSVLLVCAAAIALSAQQSPMRPGQWDITLQMQMPNVPVQMPEMKVSQCVTPEDIAKAPTATLPTGPGGAQNENCKISDYKVSGNTVTWKMACTGEQQMNGTGELTFQGDSYTGAVQISAPQGEMSMKLAGKRTGDCK